MVETPEIMIGIVAYALAGVAFGLLAGRLVFSGVRQLQGSLLVLACLLTAAWAFLVVHTLWLERGFLDIEPTMVEVVQGLAWLAFLWSLVGRDREAGFEFFHTALGLFAVAFALIILTLEGFGIAGFSLSLIARLCLVVIGMIFLENIFRHRPALDRWRIKFLVIGLGGMLAYDLFYYANLLLFRTIDLSLVQARGGVYALVTPLLAVAAYRNDLWRSDLTLSRQVAHYSTTVILSGAYILLIATAAYLIRSFGGSWGLSVQLIFVFGALLLLLVLLSSGTYRSYLNVFIQKHFFRYRYDYRNEWLRFIQATSDKESAVPLADRIVRAVADIVESPAGALWLRDGDSFSVTTNWNMAASSFSQSEAEELAGFMARKEWVLTLYPKGADIEAANLSVPSAISRLKEAWILVPLLHHSDLIGFILLARPRAPKSLTWEDFDILRTVGRQAAGYLAEQRASLALAQAQQFERFNRRSAFVLHDIKNLVSQLSLLTRNMERHGEKPEFRRDMSLTLDNAVAKMQLMIDRLSARDAEDGSLARMRIDLAPLLAEVTAGRAEFYPEEGAEGLAVQGERDRLASLFGHLVNNAVEATQGDGDGWVRVSLLASNDRAIVEVSDNGPGMDEDFIRMHLFAPFRSTKSGGFGIGTHQCRVYARELGGDLEVVSSPGAGTTMRVLLPIAAQETQAVPALNTQAGE